jgi:LEA14-like dessication related protein
MRTPLASVALLLQAALVGCAAVPPKPAGGPSLSTQAVHVAGQDLTEVTLRFQGEVQDPAGARVERATWELVSDGEVVERGETPLDVALPAGAPAPVTFEVRRRYVKDEEALRAMASREAPLLLALRGTLHLRRGAAASEATLPFAASRPVRTPRLPRVRVERLDAARYSPEEVTLTVGLGVDNPNPFPLRLSRLGWVLSVGGKALGEGTAARADTVGASSTGVYDVEASITPDTYGPGARALITRGTLPYALEGKLEGSGFSAPYSLSGEVKLNVAK